MATTAKVKFDFSNTTTETAIITLSIAIGVFYGVAKKKSTASVVGLGLLFGLGGVAIALVTSNIIDNGASSTDSAA
jgi:hypothetical protein